MTALSAAPPHAIRFRLLFIFPFPAGRIGRAVIRFCGRRRSAGTDF
jgi:hypothetical protein